MLSLIVLRRRDITMSEFLEPGKFPPSPRIDGQYLQATVACWISINSIIWQQIAALTVLQSAAIGAAYAVRPSLLSIALMMITGGATVAVAFQILRNMEVRTLMVSNCNKIVNLLMPPYLENGVSQSFEFMKAGLIARYFLVHNKTGAILLLAVLLSIDVLVAVLFNIDTKRIQQCLPDWWWPIFEAS